MRASGNRHDDLGSGRLLQLLLGDFFRGFFGLDVRFFRFLGCLLHFFNGRLRPWRSWKEPGLHEVPADQDEQRQHNPEDVIPDQAFWLHSSLSTEEWPRVTRSAWVSNPAVPITIQLCYQLLPPR